MGQQVGIGGVDPNLVAPTNLNYSATLEHKLPGNLVASVGYTGVHGYNLIADYGAVGSIQRANSLCRLNASSRA